MEKDGVRGRGGKEMGGVEKNRKKGEKEAEKIKTQMKEEHEKMIGGLG